MSKGIVGKQRLELTANLDAIVEVYESLAVSFPEKPIRRSTQQGDIYFSATHGVLMATYKAKNGRTYEILIRREKPEVE